MKLRTTFGFHKIPTQEASYASKQHKSLTRTVSSNILSFAEYGKQSIPWRCNMVYPVTHHAHSALPTQ